MDPPKELKVGSLFGYKYYFINKLNLSALNLVPHAGGVLGRRAASSLRILLTKVDPVETRTPLLTSFLISNYS